MISFERRSDLVKALATGFCCRHQQEWPLVWQQQVPCHVPRSTLPFLTSSTRHMLCWKKYPLDFQFGKILKQKNNCGKAMFDQDSPDPSRHTRKKGRCSPYILSTRVEGMSVHSNSAVIWDLQFSDAMLASIKRLARTLLTQHQRPWWLSPVYSLRSR